MNILENKMLSILTDLKENHHVIGIKAEFETEGASLDEVLRLKALISKAGLDLTIKIGGCEAIRDMYDAKDIGISSLVAPMIETPYALKKFINATHFVFSEEERTKIRFMINTETITSFNNLDDIVISEEFNELDGIVLGRADMAASMNLSREYINSEKIYEIADLMSKKMEIYKKDFVVGGGVSVDSVSFFRKLPYLSKFETRKVIFDAQKALVDSQINDGVLKALGFELMWLKNKRDCYGMLYKEDENRLVMLEAEYNKFCTKNSKICI